MNNDNLSIGGPVHGAVVQVDNQLMKNKDRLDMEYINSLSLPLWDRGWPVHDIDVETGLYRIDVCGKLEVRRIDACFYMNDSEGESHYVDDFELDPEFWVERVCLPNPERSEADASQATDNAEDIIRRSAESRCSAAGIVQSNNTENK